MRPPVPPLTDEIAHNTARTVAQIVQNAAVHASDEAHNKNDGMYVSALSIAAALNNLAILMGDAGTDDDTIQERGAKALTQESFLTALMFIKNMVACKIHDESHVSIEVTYGPKVVLDAIEDVKKLTGSDPSSKLDQNMVRSAHAAVLADDHKYLALPGNQTIN